MKHRSSRDLFSYWDQRRGRAPAPERSAIEPGAIRHALGDVFILDAERQAATFRLAGTRLCLLFGRELSGEPFLQLWDTASARELRQLMDAVMSEPIGIVGGASAQTRFDGDATQLELLLLPLRHQTRYDLRMIGSLASVGESRWHGAETPGPLTLDTHRYLHRHSAPVARLSAFRLRELQNRRGLTVYDGRRS